MVSPFVEGAYDSRHRLSHSDYHSDNDPAAHHSYYESSIDNLGLRFFSEGVSWGRQLQRDEDNERISRYKTRMRAQAVKYEEELLLRKRYREELDFLQSKLLALNDQLLAAHTAYEGLALGVTTSSSSSNSGRLESTPHLRDSSANLRERHDFMNEGDIGSASPDTEEDIHASQHMQCLGHEIDCDHLMDTDLPRPPVEFEEFGLSSPYSDPESSPSDLSDFSEPDADCKVDDDDERLDVSEIALLMSAAHGGDSTALQRVRSLIRVAERTSKLQRSAAQTHLLVYWRSPKTATATLPSPEAPEIFVDASAYGIGFIFKNRWLAWKFITAHPLLPLGPDGKLIMSWAELVAVEMGLLTLIAAGYRNIKVIVHSDNQGVVVALTSGKWTQKYDLNEIVKRVLHLSREAGFSLKMKWIPTKENPADDPSRGVYPPTELNFHCRPSIPRTLSELVHDVE